MALPNAYAQYNNSKISTASQGELTLMLYEGAIKFNNIAIVAVEAKDVEKAHKHIMKTQRIIEHLQNTLNMDYPVAKEFDGVYDYLIKRLVQANIKKDKDVLEEVNEHLRSLRETWKEVMRQARASGFGI